MTAAGSRCPNWFEWVASHSRRTRVPPTASDVGATLIASRTYVFSEWSRATRNRSLPTAHDKRNTQRRKCVLDGHNEYESSLVNMSGAPPIPPGASIALPGAPK